MSLRTRNGNNDDLASRFDSIPYRGILLFGSIAYVAMWRVYSMLPNGPIHESLRERIAVGLLCLTAFAYLTITRSGPVRTRAVFTVIAFVLTAHLYSILIRNALHPAYAFGAAVMVSVLSACLPSVRALVAYSAFVAALNVPLFFAETRIPFSPFLLGQTILLSLNIVIQRGRQKIISRLQANESRARFLSDNTFESILVLQNGRISETNRAFTETFGYSAREVSGWSFDRLLADGSPAADDLLRPGSGHVELLLRTRHDSKINADCVARHWKDEGSETIVIAMRDVTEKRGAEAILQASARWAALGEMAGGVAHEINNPLTIIYFSAEKIAKAHPAGEPVGRHARKIIETVDRIARIVQSLLTFSRGDSVEPSERARISSVLEITLPLCREKFRNAGVQLIELPANPDFRLQCRPTAISQVVLNLLNNAFDAVEGRPDAWVRIETSVSGAHGIIRVTDSGPGVAPEKQDRIMEPFFTTKAPGKGTGLGLSVSKGIVDAHGGTLFLDRTVQNTSFVVSIPIPREKPDTGPSKIKIAA